MTPVHALADQGVSVWLDDLGRDRIDSGELAALIHDVGVRGVTTNPAIFAAAVASGTGYRDRIAGLAELPADQVLHRLMVDDVRDACDAFAALFESTAGLDGRVSLEVDPRLAFDTEGSVAAARQVWADVDRPNLMVKIPATPEGLPAVTELLGSGISVNVTLIFSTQRYAEVQQAWLAGLEQAVRAGHDVSRLGSVASFFVSRLDTAVDSRLDAMAAAGDLAEADHRRLRGRAAVANARIAYRCFTELTCDPRWTALDSRGARPQRPLWASTGTKDPTFPPTRYVDELVAPDTVNTMPMATLLAVQDDPAVRQVGIDGDSTDDEAHFVELAGLGVDYADVVADLESAGVTAFIAAWERLLQLVSDARPRP